MKKQDAARLIYDGLFPAMSDEGFKLRKSEEGFVRSIPAGRDIVFVPLYDYNPVFEFSLTMGIRIDAVEATFHLFSGAPPPYQKLSYTTLTQLSYFTGDKGLFRGSTAEELQAGATLASEIVRDRIVRFFDAHQDVRALDRAVNSGPPGFDSTQLLSRAMHAVTLARLAGNPAFDSIVGNFRRELAAFSDADKSRFEGLAAHLSGLAPPPPA
jgi:hypothetical protein